MHKIWRWMLPAVGCLALISCDVDDDPMPTADGKLTLQFRQMVGGMAAVENGSYTSPGGEAFTLSNFQYYVTNVEVQQSGGQWQILPNSYYLVTLKSDSSARIPLTGLQGSSFTAIRFLLGVDSTRNVSGVQTGALDPLNGMFWTWNSGYIMAKLEGKSPVSTAPANSFSWHVGGFRTGASVLKTITLPLTTAARSGATVTVQADALKWFSGAGNVFIAQEPICHMPGTLAMRLADNYASMFTVISITQP